MLEHDEKISAYLFILGILYLAEYYKPEAVMAYCLYRNRCNLFPCKVIVANNYNMLPLGYRERYSIKAE